ncbi:MAG: hypothetical protein JWM85_2020 [Acidimicrobiaceae bacterium]|nr:hypothetical protein [Acidimicrobiaceae bacterium]
MLVGLHRRGPRDLQRRRDRRRGRIGAVRNLGNDQPGAGRLVGGRICGHSRRAAPRAPASRSGSGHGGDRNGWLVGRGLLPRKRLGGDGTGHRVVRKLAGKCERRLLVLESRCPGGTATGAGPGDQPAKRLGGSRSLRLPGRNLLVLAPARGHGWSRWPGPGPALNRLWHLRARRCLTRTRARRNGRREPHSSRRYRRQGAHRGTEAVRRLARTDMSPRRFVSGRQAHCGPLLRALGDIPQHSEAPPITTHRAALGAARRTAGPARQCHQGDKGDDDDERYHRGSTTASPLTISFNRVWRAPWARGPVRRFSARTSASVPARSRYEPGWLGHAATGPDRSVPSRPRSPGRPMRLRARRPGCSSRPRGR